MKHRTIAICMLFSLIAFQLFAVKPKRVKLPAVPGQIDLVDFSNRQDNPDFSDKTQPNKQPGFTTVKTLVPYEDLYKVIQQDTAKYFILPIEEFEQLKSAKEKWLASQSKPIEVPHPTTYQIHSTRLEGKLKDGFAKMNAYCKIETYTDEWHEIPLFWGSLAIESVMLNGNSTSLKTNWANSAPRRMHFGKLSQQNILQNYRQTSLSANDTLSQNNWKDTIFSLPIKGKGSHECRVTFMVPIENKEELFTLQFNIARIPLVFMSLEAEDFVLSVDNTTFRDFSVDESTLKPGSCTFIGWLGAKSKLNLSWRKKITRPAQRTDTKPQSSEGINDGKVASASEELPVTEPDPAPIILPLVYARSTALVSLGETSISVEKTIDYSISKAPVSSFSFVLPEKVEITSVNADRPHSYRQIKDGNLRKLRVEFMAGREDTCRIELSYEAPINLTKELAKVPEIIPQGIERELSTIAIQALTSVEVQPGNDENNPLSSGVYGLDPLEIPQSLKTSAIRPILLAYRQNTKAPNILLKIKRYKDVNQQTVVADRMDVKTTFTTNQTSNTLMSMRIRNNNKQYLQLQLASGTEVISAFRSGKPVKLVASRNDGKVQIPLEMSQTIGKPVEMNLQVLLKQPVEKVDWKGSLEFAPPLVDIPISRLNWQIFAPEQYKLYNFHGTVKETIGPSDPFFFHGFMQLLKIAWNIAISPESLVTFVFIIAIILLVIAKNQLLRFLRGIWALITGIFSYIFSGKGFRLAELMFIIAIMGALFAIAVPNFRKAREQAQVKACYANMRVLLGAVEMYNMDTPQMMKTLDIDKLVKDGYLKSKVSHPEPGCKYYSYGDLSSVDGFIACKLHGAVDGDIEEQKQKIDDINARKQMQFKSQSDSFSEQRSRAPASGFGAVKTPGTLPINVKFVMTDNYYNLQRDLVIADIASSGALVANKTCPIVKLDYLWLSFLRIGEIFAFVLALFAGLYFVSGAFLGYNSKITFAVIIIIILSIIDLKLKTIGEMANMGLWVALAGGFIWKLFWLASKFNMKIFPPDEGNDNPPPSKPDKPLPTPDSQNSLKDKIDTGKNAPGSVVKPTVPKPSPADSGKASILILVLLVAMISGLASTNTLLANETREIRVMAPFKELEKVVPASDRVVIIPEKDYEYLKSIVEDEPEEIIAPDSFRFEKIIYRGKVENNGVRFKANFRINLFNKGWKTVPLLTTTAIPSYASFDGKALTLTTIEKNAGFYGFISDATGTRDIELDFFVPLSSSEFRHTSQFELPMIPVSMAQLEITVEEDDCEAWIDPGVLLPAQTYAEKTVFKAILPPTDSLRFELYTNIKKTSSFETISGDRAETAEQPENEEEKPVVIKEKTRITSRAVNLLNFKEGFVSGINRYNLKIIGGDGIASISFLLPETIRILKVDNRLVEDWAIEETSDKRQLKVQFKSKIRGTIFVTIEFEQEMPNMQDEKYEVPEIIVENTEQSYGILGIGCLKTLEINVSQTPHGYTPVVSGEFLKEWKDTQPEKTPYAFKFLRHPNNLVLSISRPEDISQQTAVIDKAEALSLLNEDGYLLTRIVYEVRNNSQQFLKVRLPVIADKKAELWSTQVAGESVRAGFDDDHGVYNLPIIRSPIVRNEPKSFPVEMVYVIKTDQPLMAFNKIKLELPQVHLPVSELSWILYLPEGYELMRETGNVDRLLKNANTKFLYDSTYFTSVKAIEEARYRPNKSQQIAQLNRQISTKDRQQTDQLFDSSGLLPVKFSIPTTSWTTSFSMLQIEPDKTPPYLEGVLVNPRKGKGFAFQASMIFIGFLVAFGLVRLFTSKRKYLWFLILMILGGILALAIYLKLYQADHFAQMGFASSITIWLLYKFFACKPKGKEDS